MQARTVLRVHPVYLYFLISMERVLCSLLAVLVGFDFGWVAVQDGRCLPLAFA